MYFPGATISGLIRPSCVGPREEKLAIEYSESISGSMLAAITGIQQARICKGEERKGEREEGKKEKGTFFRFLSSSSFSFSLSLSARL
jgi:hypothetical protein